MKLRKKDFKKVLKALDKASSELDKIIEAQSALDDGLSRAYELLFDIEAQEEK